MSTPLLPGYSAPPDPAEWTGPAGPTGATGPAGPTGPPGEDGADGAGQWRTAISVDDHGADPDGATDSYDAFAAAVAAARAAYVATGRATPLYAPGEYLVELFNGRAETGGRLLIDFPGFELFGDGPSKSLINVRAPALPVARRLAMIDRTVPRGVVATVLANGVTLTLLADANWFSVGDNVYFSPNADGSSPRVPDVSTTGGIQDVTSTPGTTLTINNMSLFSGGNVPQPGDFVFVQYKLYLQNPGDYLLFSEGCGVRFSASPTAVADVDFRVSSNGQPTKIDNIDEAANALNLVLNHDTVTGFVDGDYVYICPNSALFLFDVSEEAATENYNLSIRDIGFTGDYWGFDQRFTTGAVDVGTRLLSYEPSFASVVEMLPARIRISNVTVEGFSSQFYMNDGVNYSAPHVRWEFDRCDLSGAASCFSMFYDDSVDKPDVWLSVHRSQMHDIDGSHIGYIHSNISLQIHESDFWNVAEGKIAIAHFGSHQEPIHVSITNCWFGPGLTGQNYLSCERGKWLFAGNTVESGLLASDGGHGTVIGNHFRPDGSDTNAACIGTYQYMANSDSLWVEDNDFDFGRIPSNAANSATALFIQLGGKYTFKGNRIFASTQSGSKEAPQVNAAFFYAVVTNTGANVNDTTTVDVIGNQMIMDTTSGQHYLCSVGYYCNTNVKDNTYIGRASSTGGPIRLVGTAGSGRVVIDNNAMDVTVGNGIAVVGAWTGSPTLAITRNRILTRTASRNPISLIHTGGTVGTPVAIDLDTEISGNYLDGQSLAIVLGPYLTAASVWGSENRFNGDLIDTTNAQRLLPRRSLLTSTVTAATSTSLNADFDTFRLVDSGAVTVNTLLLGGAASAQLAFDGAMVTLIFTTGNITLGAGGNITERAAMAGARPAGSAATLVYSATAVKWIEL